MWYNKNMRVLSPVISCETLLPHLNDEQWAVVDCRFDLKNPGWGFEDYQRSHIPGAVYAHLDRDLSSPIIPGVTGRHPLPKVEDMAPRLSRWGIDRQTRVVVYDTAGGAFAARLWWLLRYLGHAYVAVLDGGFQHWTQLGYPVASGLETRSPKTFEPEVHPEMIADLQEVDRIRQYPEYLLVDARASERYRGEVEPIDPIAGHIPGAVNRFHGQNLAQDGTFLPPAVIKQQFLELLDGVDPQNSVVYCGSGVTSIHHLIAMEYAGLPAGKLYPGSWSEWINHRKNQIAKK